LPEILGVQNQFNVHIRFPERAAVNGTDNDEHPTTNGDSSPTPPAENEEGVKKCDIIQITGKLEQVELAKQALLVSKTCQTSFCQLETINTPLFSSFCDYNNFHFLRILFQ
jgi:hypothetical protein